MPVSTSTTELDDSRVRLDVEVPGAAVERELQRVAQAAGQDMKIAGFRKGKVPPQVVIQHVGRAALLDEAIRAGMPDWYEEAVNSAGIAAVGHPKVDIGDVPEGKGGRLTFTVEVAVRPKAALGDWKGIEAPRRQPEASEEAVTAELESQRERLASLEPVDREARAGDFVVLDYTGYIDDEAFPGGEGRGQTIELGAGRLIPGFEDQLVGAKPGEDRTLNVAFPDDYGSEELAGKQARFEANVKEVREKRMPELDDEFALQAGGFDTLAELREDIARQLRELDERNAEREFREAALDAVVERAKIEVPHEVVHGKAHDIWHQMEHRLRRQGLDPAQYLAITGKSEEDLIKEAEPDAEMSLKREAVLAAIVEAENIEPTDDELLEALREATPGTDDDALRKALSQLEKDGRLAVLREDVAMRKAVDLVAESAKSIEPELAAAREKIWTPGG
ncbi:MAG TPA: trigger factor [Thermoleophilaceae bacterium]|jgi:trigger factor|nr:trigger factor [Thermoleophilaceae bacterium]